MNYSPSASAVGATMPPRPAPSRADWVHEQIRLAILSGEFAAGQPLVEADLANRFGVSKTPVREALKALASQGVVLLSTFKGANVSTVTPNMINDVFGVRGLLEPSAVAATVQAGFDSGHARDLLDRARTTDDEAQRSLLNREFHRAMYAGCDNALLVEILDALRDRTALISVTLWRSERSWEREADEHEELWKAASDGDVERARALTREHIEQFHVRCTARLTG